MTSASTTLTAEVKKKVAELGILVWLDADSQYVGFVDRLRDPSSEFSYPIVSFSGSYLELMIALKGYGSQLYPEKLLIHLPGLNKDSVQETPVFELYKAGKVFEKGLATLVREAAVGVARPDDIDNFVRGPGLSLESADAWLNAQRSQPHDPLALKLDAFGIDRVSLGLMAEDPVFAAHLPAEGEKVFAYLERSLGITRAWRSFAVGDAELRPSTMANLVAGFLMAVEFVHDLKESAVTPELAALASLGPFAKDCRRLAIKLRELHPDQYESFANELQDRFKEERTSHHANALGSIDTFRFEEWTVRIEALATLRGGNWAAAGALAQHRTTADCFWVKRSPTLQRTWEILQHAAKLGSALLANAKGLANAASLDEAVGRYADKLAAVDRQHRQFEQRFHAQIGSDLENYDELLEVRSAVRRAYREWANELARAFHKLCVVHGPLPSHSLRQRSVYMDAVHPLLENGGRVAYVLVDALRFEMAQGLADELTREKYRVSLSARLSELPSVTAVGMNALAPVEKDGRLRAVLSKGDIEGFSAGEFRVCTPDDRVRAMGRRSLDASGVVDLQLEHFHSMSLPDLKRKIAGKSLVVVRSLDLDTAGESELHLSTFERTLVQLKSALTMLSQAGVERFVVASDHGFLLQDSTIENVPFGSTMRVPERRHASLPAPSGMADVLEVRLSALEVDADEDRYLVFRPDTSVWKTSTQIASFVHGGNSLQERVIPVLVIEREGARGKTMSKYEVVARAEPAHLGRQRLCVSVRLQSQANASLPFISPKAISLALRVHGESKAIAITLLDARPPGSLKDGRIFMPPNTEEAMVEFELSGPADDKVRVEIFHPDAAEEVAAKVVDGFFDVMRDRRLKRPSGVMRITLPPQSAQAPPPKPAAAVASTASDWAELVEDEAFRKVLRIIEEQRSINEADLVTVLGSARRMRTFAREFDQLCKLIPFEIEVRTVQGMKAYVRKD